MSDETKELSKVIQDCYDRMNEIPDSIIDPAALADDAIAVIDPEKKSPILAWWAAILELRQLSRQICAKRQRENEDDAEKNVSQGTFWDRDLQPRYPAERDGRDQYVPRHLLTYEERLKNINRLRSEAFAKNAHADALQAETDKLVSIGKLVSVRSE